MTAVIVLILVVVVVFLVVRTVQAGQQQRAATKPPPRAPARRRHPSRHRAAPIDQERLAAHVKKLREAVEQDLISTEEAVDSIVRFTDGQLSEEAARQLLSNLDAA